MWTEIAKKLGVELDERFNIVNIEGQIIAENVYIDHLGMGICAEDSTEDAYLEARLICHVLNKDSGYLVKKRPYIPKELHTFYSVSNYDFTTDTSEIEELIWKDTVHQKCLLANGNVFKTEAEARKNASKVYEKCQNMIDNL